LALLLAWALVGCTQPAASQNGSGNAEFEQGDYEAAIRAYRLAQISAPERPEPYYNAANAYNRRGLLESVVILSRQALATADADLAARIWYNLGNAFFDRGAWSQAIQAYREALVRVPDDLDAKHNLELALQRLAEQEETQKQDGASEQDEAKTDSTAPGDDTQALTPTPPAQGPEEPPQDENGGGQPTLTSEQAEQLLRAVVGPGQMLQSRLTQRGQTPAQPPVRDW
jgi:tetratricopeptide (TPR) repeat protein